jgi:hypothetical protein
LVLSAVRLVLSLASTRAVAFFPMVAVALSACAAPHTQSPSAASTALATTPIAASRPVGVTTTASSVSSAPVDSCLAISQLEAGGALGQTVRAPVRGRATVEGGVACVFYGSAAPPGADPDVPVTDSVRVVLVRGPEARSFFNDYRSKVQAQPVAGLGDQAYYDGFASLSVLKGDAYLRIAVIGVVDVLGAEKKLAAAALPRM